MSDLATQHLKVWRRQERNVMLEMDGFWISYNPNTDTGAETALCKDGNYYILLGDFRKQYEQLVDKGFNACLKFFKENLDKKSSWSDGVEGV